MIYHATRTCSAQFAQSEHAASAASAATGRFGALCVPAPSSRSFQERAATSPRSSVGKYHYFHRECPYFWSEAYVDNDDVAGRDDGDDGDDCRDVDDNNDVDDDD